MQIVSEFGFSPLCISTLGIRNRASVPSSSGINCKPCSQAITGENFCCCNCYTFEFEGATLTPTAGCTDPTCTTRTNYAARTIFAPKTVPPPFTQPGNNCFPVNNSFGLIGQNVGYCRWLDNTDFNTAGAVNAGINIYFVTSPMVGFVAKLEIGQPIDMLLRIWVPWPASGSNYVQATYIGTFNGCSKLEFTLDSQDDNFWWTATWPSSFTVNSTSC